MRVLTRSLLILFSLGCFSLCAQGQSAQKTGTGVITGRVTVGDRGVPDITVLLTPGEFGPDRKAIARTTTDADGNYRLMNVPAGRYNIVPVAPTMPGPAESTYGGPGRSIIIGEGEMVEKMDFALVRGGVITGRVTDADGKPVIEERLQLLPADNQNRSRLGFYNNPFMFQTDDRGIYRIYGVPPGRYILSAGISPQDGMARFGLVNRGYYQRTFYPSETDSKKATVIEVAEGGEVKDVDIKLGRASKTFRVSGRVVDAETGKPVPNQIIGYGTYDAEERQITSFGYSQGRTDSRGQFQVEGLVPGRYAAFTINEESNAETYAEPAPFKITDADVSGIEVRVRRGTSLSGIAQIEGTSDKRVLARLSQLTLGVSVHGKGLTHPVDRRVLINADGSFRITGLPPGTAMFYISAFPKPKDIRLARIERDGVAQQNGVEVAPGAEVGNVRLILEYGTGSVRGQVRVDNGELPEGSRMFVIISKAEEANDERPINYAQVDSRRRFLLEGLSPGDYRLSLRVQVPVSNIRVPEVKQTVSIANGIESETTLILDLTQKERGGANP